MSYEHRAAHRAPGEGPAAPRLATHPWARGRLLDGDLALHAGLPVAGHGAVERVGPRLERDLDRRDLAALDDRALLLDAVALDGDVVERRGLVEGGEREQVRLRGGLRGDVRLLPGRIRVDLQLALAHGGRLAADDG